MPIPQCLNKSNTFCLKSSQYWSSKGIFLFHNALAIPYPLIFIRTSRKNWSLSTKASAGFFFKLGLYWIYKSTKGRS
jgi:hypothetical protein